MSNAECATSAPPASAEPGLLRRLWHMIKHDLQSFWGTLAPLPVLAAGLHTFRIELPGGQRRLHLRVDPDGAGVLFVDVTDVIHLNPTALQMVVLALHNLPRSRARTTLRLQYSQASYQQLDHELAQIYALVDRVRQPESGCTCNLTPLERAPLFSTCAGAPYKADLALTYGCNNECAHCYNEPDRLAMPSLPQADWLQIIDTLTSVGVPHLIFTGGEATLHPDLPALINYADQQGHIVGLNTNGRRLAQPAFVQTLVDAGLNHVQITLGSSRPEVHNRIMHARSFSQTIEGIRNAVASPLHTITNTTLMRCNCDHVEEIIDFLYALGIRTFAMNGMIYSGGGNVSPDAIPEQEIAPLLVRVRDHAATLGMRFLWYTPTEYCRMSPVELEIGAKRCNAGEYSLCVEPNGDVLPCQSFYVAAGNLLRDPWEQIWQSELFRSFRDREDDPRRAGLPEKCWACPDLPLCGGGCRIEREARDGQCSSSGGCSSSGCGRSDIQQPELPATGFIPVAGLVKTDVRSQGTRESVLIPLEQVTVQRPRRGNYVEKQ